jgi:hypothetical protein
MTSSPWLGSPSPSPSQLYTLDFSFIKSKAPGDKKYAFVTADGKRTFRRTDAARFTNEAASARITELQADPAFTGDSFVTVTAGRETDLRCFTPHDEDGRRLRLFITAEDVDKVTERGDFDAVITDRATLRRYRATRSDCGLGCRCDALARPVE